VKFSSSCVFDLTKEGALLGLTLVQPVPEQSTITAIMLVMSIFGLALQLLGVGSGAMFILTAVNLLVALGANAAAKEGGDHSDIRLWTYAIGQIVPLATGMQLMASTLDVFVPLVGFFFSDRTSGVFTRYFLPDRSLWRRCPG
jgi:hypothetical protein